MGGPCPPVGTKTYSLEGTRVERSRRGGQSGMSVGPGGIESLRGLGEGEQKSRTTKIWTLEGC